MTVRLRLPIRALIFFVMIFAQQVYADVLDDVLDRGTLRIGVSEFVPWTMKSKSGELIGFEIEVARKIASDMGVTPEFTVYQWEDIIPALQKGEIDVIAGGMAITPARALKVNFSRPLAESGVSLATNSKRTANIESLSQLNNDLAVIAVVADTFAHSVAQTFFDQADIEVFASSDLAEQEVLEGRAHVYLATVAEVNFLALMNPDTVDVPMSEPLMASKEGLAVKKGEQELLNFLDAWVVAREADKWLGATHQYWFNTIEWVSDVKR
jgi:polar amino acid transport system substrate-binding protein